MTVKLLNIHHLEFLTFKVDCTGLSENTCQNSTLLEITCHGSNMKMSQKYLCRVAYSTRVYIWLKVKIRPEFIKLFSC